MIIDANECSFDVAVCFPVHSHKDTNQYKPLINKSHIHTPTRIHLAVTENERNLIRFTGAYRPIFVTHTKKKHSD